MLVWQIAVKDIKMIFKDFKALLLIILFPIILIMILGMSLDSFFDKSDGNIYKAKVVLIDNDKSNQSESLVELFSEDSVKKYVTVLEMGEEEAEKKLADCEIHAIIKIPNKFEENLLSGKENNVVLLSDKGKPTQSSIVLSILERYIDTVNMVYEAQNAVQSSYSNYEMDAGMVMQDIGNLLSDQDDVIKITGFSNSKETLSSLQYYSPAILSMFILFVGMLGTSSFLNEKEEGTFTRMLAANVQKGQIIAGKVLGIFLIGLMDSIILILFTKIFYKVDWGNSLIGLSLVTVSMVFAASGLSILIATFFKRSKDVDMVNTVVIFIMALVGGNMLSFYDMTPVLRKGSQLLFNNWSLRAYLNLMINNDVSSIFVPSIIMVCMGIIFMAIGILRIKFDS